MKLIKNVSLIVVPLAMIATHGVFAQENELGWTMERAVKQLDRQGQGFETVLAEANIEWKDKDGMVDKTVNGRIYMNDDGDVRLSAQQPTEYTMLLSGPTLYEHDPAKAVVEEYRLSQHKDRLEPFVALGFSTTGKDLSKRSVESWIIRCCIELRFNVDTCFLIFSLRHSKVFRQPVC